MSDEPRQEPEEDAEKKYEAPEAEELPANGPEATATGLNGTPSDDRSDRNLKTDFAEVEVEAVLARVRQHRVDL
jgi:hypothetical protein